MPFLYEISSVYAGASVGYFQKSIFKNAKQVELVGAESIAKDGRLNLSQTTTTWVEQDFPEKFYLQNGDVLAQMRGGVFKASIVKDMPKDQLFTVNSNIAIIRLHAQTLLPEVLCFYLNSHQFQQTVIQKSQTNLILIKLKVLAEIKIEVPSFEKQPQIKALYDAHLDLADATLALLEQQQKTTEAKFFDLLKSADPL